jgi:hypothetical protein
MQSCSCVLEAVGGRPAAKWKGCRSKGMGEGQRGRVGAPRAGARLASRMMRSKGRFEGERCAPPRCCKPSRQTRAREHPIAIRGVAGAAARPAAGVCCSRQEAQGSRGPGHGLTPRTWARPNAPRPCRSRTTSRARQGAARARCRPATVRARAGLVGGCAAATTRRAQQLEGPRPPRLAAWCRRVQAPSLPCQTRTCGSTRVRGAACASHSGMLSTAAS